MIRRGDININLPLLSIITVSYNAEPTIEDSISSVLSQKDERIEYVVVDGASTDLTYAIIQRYSNEIDVIVSEPDKGIYDAMNKGVELSSGEYICFLNSDDYYDKDILSDVLSILGGERPDILYGDLTYIDSMGKQKRHWISGTYHVNKLKKLWVPPHPATFLTRALFDDLGGFYTQYKLAADYDLLIRALRMASKIHYIDKVIVKMREGGATNASVRNIVQQNIEIIQSYHSMYQHYPLFGVMHKIFNRIFQKIRANKFFKIGEE